MSETSYRDCPMCDVRYAAIGKLSESGKCLMFRCGECSHRFAGALKPPDRRLTWDVLEERADEPPPRNWDEVHAYVRHLNNDVDDEGDGDGFHEVDE